MKLDADELDIFKTEWTHCESGIGRFDTLVFQIRGWAASVLGVLLAAAFTLEVKGIVIIAILIMMVFWSIEAINKSYQAVLIERSREIEELFLCHMNSTVTEEMKSRSMTALRFKTMFSQPNLLRFLYVWRTTLYMGVWSFYISLITISALCLLLIRLNAHPLEAPARSSGSRVELSGPR